MTNVNKIYNYILKKYKWSRNIFILLNFISLFLAAAIIVLNLFAIRFNPVKLNQSNGYNLNEKTIMWLFISLAILSAISGLFTSILSFFVFHKKSKKNKEKIELINIELRMYKKEEDEYSSNKKDEILLEKVIKIKNS